MKTTKATKSALSALEQALSDMGQCLEPRREDEFTAQDMQEKLKGVVGICTIQRQLHAMVKSGRYVRRRLGRDFLYRKS